MTPLGRQRRLKNFSDFKAGYAAGMANKKRQPFAGKHWLRGFDLFTKIRQDRTK